jgi:pepF/M3 family oligoendopeptidase
MTTAVVEKLPHWDLSNVYPTLDSDAFARDIDAFKAQLDDLDAYLATHQISRSPEQPPDLSNRARLAEIVSGVLERMNAIYLLYGTLNAYLASFVTTDSYNNDAKKRQSELELIGVRTSHQNIKFAGWMGLIADALPQALQQPGIAQAHAFYLQELAEQSKYLMSEAEESLAAELNLSGGNAWSKLHGVVTSQLAVRFARNGTEEKMPITALQNLRSDPDADVRRRAYQAEMAAWESVREPLAAAMNGIKGTVATLNQRRGRVDALHAALDQTRIDRQTLEAMMGAMRDSFPMFRKYFKAKAARLGHKALPWWDLTAPAGKSERRFTWHETRDFIIEQFGHFSETMARFAQRAFDDNWIDAEPRDGKRGGAFCMAVPRVKESRVLCNFDGSLDQVFTVAHELGHGFHNECLRDRAPLQRITPMTLAETASIFCETIVTDAALSSVSDPREELAILETALIGASQVIVDISSRFIFEQEVFERRARSELSADDLCEIMLRAQEATYGDGLDPQYRNKYMWAWKPHYYNTGRSFYNYPYAFGLLFGSGLYALYLERGKSFIPEYETLLSSTGMHNAADLAARFGIDIRAKDFWKSSLDTIGKRVERYVEL